MHEECLLLFARSIGRLGQVFLLWRSAKEGNNIFVMFVNDGCDRAILNYVGQNRVRLPTQSSCLPVVRAHPAANNCSFSKLTYHLFDPWAELVPTPPRLRRGQKSLVSHTVQVPQRGMGAPTCPAQLQRRRKRSEGRLDASGCCAGKRADIPAIRGEPSDASLGLRACEVLGAANHDNKASSHFSTTAETLPLTRSANVNNVLRASPTG